MIRSREPLLMALRRTIRHGTSRPIGCPIEQTPMDPISKSSRTFLDGRPVPDLDQAVLARRGDQPTIGAEGDAPDTIGMAPEGDQLLAGNSVPELDRLVLAGRGDAQAIRAENHFLDRQLARDER